MKLDELEQWTILILDDGPLFFDRIATIKKEYGPDADVTFHDVQAVDIDEDILEDIEDELDGDDGLELIPDEEKPFS